MRLLAVHALVLIAGLGNPGRQYEDTRHNAGFMAVDALAAAHEIQIKRRKFDALYEKGRIEGRDVVIAKPQTYMNLSGACLRALADFFRIRREALIVVHDDIDLAFERLKINERGGDGGHKGIRSIINAFGGDQFVRVRMGVGRPEDGREAADHVLQAFAPDEKSRLDGMLRRTCEAIVTILTKGTQEGMNRFNRNPR